MAKRRKKDINVRLFHFTKDEEQRMLDAQQCAMDFMAKFGLETRAYLPVTDLPADDGYPKEMKFRAACEYLGVDGRALTTAVKRGYINPYHTDDLKYYVYDKQELIDNRERIMHIAKDIGVSKKTPKTKTTNP